MLPKRSAAPTVVVDFWSTTFLFLKEKAPTFVDAFSLEHISNGGEPVGKRTMR